jgi:hypothetical protein
MLPHDMPMQARIGGGGIARTHSQPGTRRRWVVSTMLRLLQPRFSPEKDPLPIVQEAGWASEPVWAA